ncbi:MAG TPA: DUF896 domain-containing protein [Clostridiales bacterium]|nr:DUF896 domain-containing protein [Clostridiales bacterium]
MEQSKIDRINELARLAKCRELTPEEAAERQKLREEYVAAVRRNLEQALENTYIDDGRGNLRKLRRREKGDK